ncbi:MAG TPA: single-stranded-DNA-specific exonuclease RecJ [Polyangia bacterium]
MRGMESSDPRAPARWLTATPDRDRATELGRAIGLSPLCAQLLLNRGVSAPAEARRYLAPRLGDLRRPDGDQAMRGFGVAVGRLERALAERETIGIFGDYDVDGVTSAALLTRFLREAGGQVVPRVARRDAGYGFGAADAQALSDAGCKVAITCDCGTSDHDALAHARSLGLDAIVVDHHQVPDREIEALALINPHQPGCLFPFKGLASVGVAFYLAAALRTRLRERGWPSLPDPRALLDLVALGTVADLAPLTFENRILVHAGLERLRQRSHPGLEALCQVSGLPDGVRRTADLGLRLGPRLNAPGRLGAAQLALDLLLCDDPARAPELASACEDANRRRKDVQERVLREALADGERQARLGHAVIVAAGQGWHPGVVGIVAARLVERFHRPAAVIALDGELGRGSLRTANGFDLHAGLAACADLLVRFGGHAAAAGLTIEKSKLPALSERLGAEVRRALGERPPGRELRLDAEIGLDLVDEPLIAELERLEPFGIGNPEPLFGARGVTLERARVVGDTHLQVTLRDGDYARDGIGFGLAEGAPASGARVRAAFFPEVDTFRGVRRVRVRLRDLASEP